MEQPGREGSLRTQIVYEDRDILVIWKPAGLAAQTARVGQADVVSELKNYLAAAQGSGGRPYLGVIHRLDQPVEGLLVFAKNKKAAAVLTRQLGGAEEGLLNKRYYAVVGGKPSRPEGMLVDYLRKGADGRAEAADVPAAEKDLRESGCAVGEKAPISEKGLLAGEGSAAEKPPAADGFRRAVLWYRLLQTVEALPGREISLVEIRLETGRFHQIRAQMAKAGTPLLGDLKYGSRESVDCGERLGIGSVALCAGRIELIHPATGKSMCFERKPEGKAFSFFEA